MRPDKQSYRGGFGAGAPGFEPGSDGSKGRCLTAWPRPNSDYYIPWDPLTFTGLHQGKFVLILYKKAPAWMQGLDVIHQGIEPRTP